MSGASRASSISDGSMPDSTGVSIATPVCGTTMAYTMANNEDHELIKPFNLSRFQNFAQVGEKGAASVGH